ncbi:MAG: DUF2062 domain-containing protein [Candidatus Omnitrophota bacterium]
MKPKEFLKDIFIKLFKIDDTPQKISLGFGLGVFLGIFPGTGPIAAIFLALLLKVNRASALLGCMLTNTWISVVAVLLAIKTGSMIMGVNWHTVNNQLGANMAKLHWLDLFKTSSLKVLLPVFIGYIAIGLCMGLITYLIALFAIKRFKR